MNFKLIHAVSVFIVSSVLLFSQSIQKKQVERVMEGFEQSTSSSELIKQLNDVKSDPLIFELENILDESLDKKDNSDAAERTIKEINEIQSSSKSINDPNEESSDAEVINIEKDESTVAESVLSSSLIKNNKSNDYRTEYFGYSTFKTNPDFFNKSVEIATSPNYVIGPGDEIIIMLWGQTEDQSSYIVSREGYIFVKNIGQIFVNGLNLEKLEKKLKKIFQKSYSSISPDDNRSPTFFDVSLGSAVLKPIRVFIMGEVDNPGAYEMKPTATLFSSLYYFNGPKISGSLRDIHLIRGGKKIATIDFYDFLVKGEKKNDKDLIDGDIIFIPLRSKTVSVEGEVNRPSIFELKDDESFSDLYNFFGGYLSTTYLKRAKINRINPIEDRIRTGSDRKLLDLNLYEIEEDKIGFDVLDGDSFTFYKIFDLIGNSVSIRGPVKRPGQYSHNQNITIFDLIGKADGLSSSDIYRDRVDVIRKLGSNKESLLSYNLDSILVKSDKHNVYLFPGDTVILYNFSDMIHSSDLRIQGHVESPGVKKFRDGMTVSDLIFAGGGFNNTDHLGSTYLPRADLYRYDKISKNVELISFNLDSVLNGMGISQQLLKMGDKIRIYSKAEIFGLKEKFVYVDGFVKYPGEYEFAEGMTIKDILFMSSGIKDKRRYSNIFLQRIDIKRQNESGKYDELIKLNLKNKINDFDENLKLSPGDRIIIYSNDLFEKKRKVAKISGLVNRPGNYELFDGMNIGDVILAAGGLVGKNNEFRVEISSFNYDGSEKKTFINSFNIKNLSDNFIDNKNNVLNKIVYDNDFISIFSKQDAFHHTVSLEGEINYPGDYVLIDRESKLHNIIERAGGLTEYANDVASYLVRDGERISLRLDKIQKSKRSKYNISLIDGDTITFDRKTGIVKISGEVATPGVYQYVKGLSSKDYIDLAGGFSKDASRQGATIKYPNGFSSKIGLLKDPTVMDGSEIIILKKEDIEPFSFTEYVGSLTAIYSDLLQAYTLVLLLGNSNSN